MVEDQEAVDDRYAGRIEGGIDAIVIGANADGLAAAAYLGKAGLHTVLLDSGAEIGGEIRKREFAEGAFCVDGEHLVSALDPEAIDDLDLYRHGVAYGARRIDTTYFFENGESLEVDGDVMNAAASIDEEDGGGLAFQSMTQDAFEAALLLRPAFEMTPPPSSSSPARGKSSHRGLEKALETAPADIARRLNDYAVASGDAMLDSYLPDGPLKTALLCEIAWRSSAPPHEPFSFMNLIRRWSGETSGLQGAIAYPKGGAVNIIDALRRAAQAAKVEIRAASPVEKILIERDRAAGVQLVNGGQLRAPIIITALDARRVFLNMIGAAGVDIELHRAISAVKPVMATARLHLALRGAARDEKTKESMRRRIVFAPSPEALRRSFGKARAGEIPEDLIIEAVFPNALDEENEESGKQLLSIMAHPLPFDAAPTDARRGAIQTAILKNTEHFAPAIAERIAAADLSLPADLANIAGATTSSFAAKPGVMQQWALAGLAVAAGRINGFYFCGPEAQIGPGLCCAAGRIAAKTALKDSKRRDVAA